MDEIEHILIGIENNIRCLVHIQLWEEGAKYMEAATEHKKYTVLYIIHKKMLENIRNQNVVQLKLF